MTATAQGVYTLADHKEVMERLRAGTLTAAELRAAFARALASEAGLKAEFSRLKVDQLKRRVVMARGRKKADMVEEAHQRLLTSFTPGQSLTWSFGEKVEDAIRRAVAAVTDDDIRQYAERVRANTAALVKALTNPETRAEFDIFIARRGAEHLSAEQRERYDALVAEAGLEQRRAEVEQRRLVRRFTFEARAEMIEGWHQKAQVPLWIVRFKDRLTTEQFGEAKIKAHMLDGNWSNFVREYAGFQFRDRRNAERFLQLLSGDVDRLDVLDARTERREGRAADRLHAVAEAGADRAESSLSRDRKTNTLRRLRMAESAEAQARADLRLSRVVEAIATALAAGELRYLRNIRAKTHVDTLDRMLVAGMLERDRRLGVACPTSSRDPVPEDVEPVEFPYPTFNRAHLRQAADAMAGTPGSRLLSARVVKLCEAGEGASLTVRDEGRIEAVADLLRRAGRYSGRVSPYIVEWLRAGLADYQRLRTCGIANGAELRTALREYLRFAPELLKEDPVRRGERRALLMGIPGFFPTPPDLAAQLLEMADPQPGEVVVEPSAGFGRLAEAILDYEPEVILYVLELRDLLRDLLAQKGLRVAGGDFFDCDGHLDGAGAPAPAIDLFLMNPPFEEGQELPHLYHAYRLLRAGGRLASIVSEGLFHRAAAKYEAFRHWFEAVGVAGVKNPEGAFRNAERPTGVSTRCLLIRKLEGAEPPAL